jgi:biotin operon repressor
VELTFVSFIEEPHLTRSRQRFRLLASNCDKLIKSVLEVVNSYKDGGLNRQEFFRDIRDRQKIDVGVLDKEFLEELENSAGILYMRGEYRLNMNRLLMLINMFLKEIERVDKDRADELRKNVNQINLKIDTLTGETTEVAKTAKTKLPEYEEIEKEEIIQEPAVVGEKAGLEPVDKALTTYIKEYDKLSLVQISSVLGISENEVKKRLSYLLEQGILVGKIQDEYFLREAVSVIPTPAELVKAEAVTEVTKITKEAVKPTEEVTVKPPAIKSIETPVVEEAIAKKPVLKELEVEKPEVLKTTVEEPVVEEPVVEEPVVEEPVVEEPVVVERIESVVTKEAAVETPMVETAEVAPPEEVTYTPKEIKEIYKRMKLFIEMVSQVLEMVVVPDKPGFDRKALYKLIYDYYFLPIDGSFDVEPFKELAKEGVVQVEENWIRIDLDKSLSLFKNKYLPGIRKVKKRTASKLEKALDENIEQMINNLLKTSA